MDELLTHALRERILARIVPTSEEVKKQQQVTDSLVDALSRRAKILDQHYSFIEPQGSTGRKQTQLRGAADIDLFVGLKPDDYAETLALQTKERQRSIDDLLNSLVDAWFIPALKGLDARNMQKTYSQHPYLSLVLKGLDVDIIGCFDVSADELACDGPITAVDRTVHHTRYVVAHMNDRTREDVRILKSFVRASHAYGDAAAVGKTGFTGYSLELAVIMVGGFDSAIMAIRNLENSPMDPLGRPLENLRAIPAFRDDYVFIIDPTDQRRNVASSFTSRTCRWLSHRVDMLLENAHSGIDDTIGFFVETPVPNEPLPQSVAAHALVFEFVSDETVHYTVIRDKLYRVAADISSILERERNGERRFGRVLTEVHFEGNRFALGILVERPEIPAVYPRRGPSSNLETPSAEFRRAHPSVYEQDGYLWVDERRQWTSASQLCRHIMKEHQVRGLGLSKDSTVVSSRVLCVLYRYVLPLEKDFIMEDKEGFATTA